MDITGSLAYLHTLRQHIPVPQSPCVGIISQKRVIRELWVRFQFHPFQTSPSFNRCLFARQMLNWKWEAELMPTGQKRVPEDTPSLGLSSDLRLWWPHRQRRGYTEDLLSAPTQNWVVKMIAVLQSNPQKGFWPFLKVRILRKTSEKMDPSSRKQIPIGRMERKKIFVHPGWRALGQKVRTDLQKSVKTLHQTELQGVAFNSKKW